MTVWDGYRKHEMDLDCTTVGNRLNAEFFREAQSEPCNVKKGAVVYASGDSANITHVLYVGGNIGNASMSSTSINFVIRPNTDWMATAKNIKLEELYLYTLPLSLHEHINLVYAPSSNSRCPIHTITPPAGNR